MPKRLLMLLGATVLLVAIAAACGGSDEVPLNSPVPATADSLAIGGQIFQDKCQACHGDGITPGPVGMTLVPPPLRLVESIPLHSDRTLYLAITEGVPADEEPKRMPSWKGLLTETERWHAVNYVRATFDRGIPTFVLPTEEDAPPDAEEPAAPDTSP
jgi:mono/diheme cytochrome c family protein